MFFVKKIDLDETKCYQSSSIVVYTKENHTNAKSLFESSVINFVKEEQGREAASQVKIIDINGLEQVNEPLVDSMLLYRVVTNPNRIYVYQRKTIIVKVKGWTWGEYDIPTTQFRQVNIFELEEFSSNVVPVESIKKEPSVVKIDSKLTVECPADVSTSDLISELRKNPIFQRAQEENNK